MRLLMITWTDIFNGTGACFQWIFKGMYKLGNLPNVFMGAFIIFLLAYWSIRILKHKKAAVRNGTYQ